ncbi:MAG: 4Fe-4S dicluster domain-containing protein [Ruminococcus sp.]|nr:4Fe-4S dicluster domain-containing protein [Ruminococcus sp.]
MEKYFGENVPKLGFGLMRLPKLSDGKIDIEQTKEMVDLFLDAGLTYFDTAYVYDNGESEKAAKAALVDRHPRESYTLCTKLCAWMGANDEKSAKQQFYTSLERTGAGYFDYYLLHALQRSNYKIYDEYHIWDFVKEQKAKGLIKYYGFSFHADSALLEELLTDHPDVDFVQLQINYADWENPGVESRECWEIARRHGKSITIMEPVKGGALADPVPAVQKILKSANKDASLASWAVRFAASLDGIITVLSGMSNLEQMKDNISYMKNFKPLDEAEQAVIRRAQEALKVDESVPCTACHYCTDGCPKNIPIPEIFSVKNRQRGNAEFRGKREYVIATEGKGRASDCIECGQCENACPQQIKVISHLKSCAEQFED